MNVRKANRKDFKTLVALKEEFYSEEAQFEQEVDLAEISDAINEFYEKKLGDADAVFYLAEEDKKPAGYVLALISKPHPGHPAGEVGVIADIYIKPEHREMGVGASLLEAVESWLGGKGVRHIQVHVFAENRRARIFWEKHGYGDRIITKEKEFRGD